MAASTDPSEIFVALTSAAVDVTRCDLKPGDPLYGSKDFDIAAGMRLRADHPVVVAHPTLFIRESAPDDEISAARNAIGADRPQPDVWA